MNFEHISSIKKIIELSFYKKIYFFLICLIIVIGFQTFFEVLFASFIGNIIKLVISKDVDTFNLFLNYTINLEWFIFFGLTILTFRFIFSIISIWISRHIGNLVAIKLTKILIENIFYKITPNEKTSRSEQTRDLLIEIDNFSNSFIATAGILFVELFIVFVCYLIIIINAPILGVAILIFILLCLLINQLLYKLSVHYGFERIRIDQNRFKKINALIENKNWARPSGFIHFLEKSFLSPQIDFFKLGKKISILQVLPKGFFEFLSFGSLLIFIYNYKPSNFDITSITLAMGALFRCLLSVGKITACLNTMIYNIPSASILLRHVNKNHLFNYEDKIPIKNENDELNVNIEKVFLNEKNLIFKKSFKIKLKKFNLLSGPSGSGKTSLLLALINERNFKGKITVNQKLIESFMDLFKVQYVPQQIYPIHGSLWDNIAMGRNISEEKVKQLFKKFDLNSIAKNKSEMKNKSITELTASVSGGQLQRIAIIRALLDDADIYIFDETFSGIDNSSRNKYVEIIKKLKPFSTFIAVSHYPFLKKHVDNVIELA